MSWPAVAEHKHVERVVDNEVFMHLVQDHAMIASSKADAASMQKTHEDDHADWKRFHG